MTTLRLLAVSSLLFAACGGDDADLDLSSRDPRCVAACPETVQQIDGVGDICNTASRALCLDTCEARIAGVMPACQTCLTEESCFDPDNCDDQVGQGCGPDGKDTVTGWNGTCTYTCSDMAARINCLKQVEPTREVACTAEFRPTSECASVCN
jgi:hypothetical protein